MPVSPSLSAASACSRLIGRCSWLSPLRGLSLDVGDLGGFPAVTGLPDGPPLVQQAHELFQLLAPLLKILILVRDPRPGAAARLRRLPSCA
ncbi:hypothetical protein ACFYQ5_27960 [Streptomyces sp. NPDC005794]|uniref:hypothetical protein n=1 Tax=Streptomyces sp. NPDC005794 TaxID=3364733 RepID=UPI003685B8FB